MTTTFEDFVVVIASKKPLKLSDYLKNNVIKSEEPFHLKTIDVELHQKKNRKLKSQVVHRKETVATIRSSQKKKKSDLFFVEPSKDFRPCLTYMHFLCKKKKDGTVKQTYKFVL